jgi:heavy metal sensor kinase
MKVRWFKHIRTRLTLRYAGVVVVLLIAFAAVNLTFQHEYLRRQLDLNLKEDLEILEDLLATNELIVNPLLQPFDHRPQPYERFVEIWSEDGRRLYHSSAFQFETLPAPPTFERYGDTPRYFSLEFPDGKRWRSIGVRVERGEERRVVRISMSEDHVLDQLREIATFTALSLPLFVLVALASGYYLAWKALRPIDELVRQVRSFNDPEGGQRLVVSNPDDELGDLARVTNGLLARIESTFQQLRRFTADASHELRTPLAAMRSVGEIGLQTGQTTDQLRETIGSMLEENIRLTRLVDALLFLSRGDGHAIALRPEAFDVDSLLRESVELVAVLADEKKQRVSLDLPDRIAITADKVLLRRAILNVLDNAIKYTPPGGRIRISARTEPRDLVQIEIQDDGPGIPSDDRERVFGRFVRLGDDRSRTTGGAGLGLAIVRWVIDAHRGSVRIEDADPGCRIVMTLPRPYSGSLLDA